MFRSSRCCCRRHLTLPKYIPIGSRILFPAIVNINCYQIPGILRSSSSSSSSGSGSGSSPDEDAHPSSSAPQTQSSFNVFDRKVKRIHRDNAARNAEESRNVDYLRSEIAARLVDRLSIINRDFQNVLDLGAGSCHIARSLLLWEDKKEEEGEAKGKENADENPVDYTQDKPKKRSAPAVSRLVCVELSKEMLYRDHPLPNPKEGGRPLDVELVHADEEVALRPGGPFPDSSFDAVVSGGSMHWINDLPSALRDINRVLKPDGPLMAAMFGGDSLYELRSSLQLADLDRLGGVTPHVSPLADIRDVGGLLQQAKFKLLTIDVEEIVVEYPDVFALMKDLGNMGEGNAVMARRMTGLGKEVLYSVDGIYREMYGTWGGSLPATFRIIHFIGWKESPNQPKPLKRGSGQTNLKDALKT